VANYRLRIGHNSNYLLQPESGSYVLSGQAVTLTFGSGSIAVSLETNRTSGPAPLGIVFNATGTTATAIAEVTQPWRQLYYQWNYDDSGSGTFATTGNSKNVDAGCPMGAHVYNIGAEGVKTATLTVTLGYPWLTAHKWLLNDFVTNGGQTYKCTSTHTAGSTTQPGVGASWNTVWSLYQAGLIQDSDTVAITVQNADTVYSGTNTVCINGTGLDDGLGPVGCSYVALFPSTQADNTRYLFKRDGVYTNWTINRTRTGVQIGAYGTGADPLFTSATYCRICSDSTPSGATKTFPTNCTVWGLDLRGGIREYITSINTLIHRCTIDAVAAGVDLGVRCMQSIAFYADPTNLAVGWLSTDYFYATGRILSELTMRGTTTLACTIFGGQGWGSAVIGCDMNGSEETSNTLRVGQAYKLFIGNNKIAGPAGVGDNHWIKLHSSGQEAADIPYDFGNEPKTELAFVQSNKFGGEAGDNTDWAVHFAPQTTGDPPGDSEQLDSCMAINNVFDPAGINGFELRFVGTNLGAYGNTRTSGSLRTAYITDHSTGYDPSVVLTPYFGQGA
jgi:hypothetical protein